MLPLTMREARHSHEVKKILEALSVLERAVLHLSYEKGFGQRCPYKTIKLLDAKKQTTIKTYFT
jgi:hypothetical protein